jgi:hypothetical protein
MKQINNNLRIPSCATGEIIDVFRVPCRHWGWAVTSGWRGAISDMDMSSFSCHVKMDGRSGKKKPRAEFLDKSDPLDRTCSPLEQVLRFSLRTMPPGVAFHLRPLITHRPLPLPLPSAQKSFQQHSEVDFKTLPKPSGA